MRIKNLHWYVFEEDFNHRKIIKYDIFRHGSFAEDLKKANRMFKADKDFLDEVERLLHYYFWAKCEHEVLIGSPFKGTNPVKIDVWDQIEMNWDHFSKYLLENRKK